MADKIDDDDLNLPSYNEAMTGISYTVEPLSIQATFEELSEGGHKKRSGHQSSHAVKFEKRTKSGTIGITLVEDASGNCQVYEVEPGSAVAGLLQPFDLLLEIDGVCIEPNDAAVHAAKLLRSRPVGTVEIVKRPRSPLLERSALLLQDWWRSRVARGIGVERRVILKPDQAIRLGLTLSSEFPNHAIVALTAGDSLASRAFDEGDLITRLNGMPCTNPYDTVQALRAASGPIEFHVVRSCDVDRSRLACGDCDVAVLEATAAARRRRRATWHPSQICRSPRRGAGAE